MSLTRRLDGTVIWNEADSRSGRIAPAYDSVLSMPWMRTGKCICIASDSSSVSACIRTTASPCSTAFTRQSTRASPPAAISTVRDVSPSGVSDLPSSSRTTRTDLAVFRRLCTLADSTTSSCLDKEPRRLHPQQQILRRDDLGLSLADARAGRHGPAADFPSGEILRHAGTRRRPNRRGPIRVGRPKRPCRQIACGSSAGLRAGRRIRLVLRSGLPIGVSAIVELAFARPVRIRAPALRFGRLSAAKTGLPELSEHSSTAFRRSCLAEDTFAGSVRQIAEDADSAHGDFSPV